MHNHHGERPEHRCTNPGHTICGACQQKICNKGLDLECISCLTHHGQCIYIRTGLNPAYYIEKLRRKPVFRFCIKCEDKYNQKDSHICKRTNTKDYLDVLKELK